MNASVKHSHSNNLPENLLVFRQSYDSKGLSLKIENIQVFSKLVVSSCHTSLVRSKIIGDKIHDYLPYVFER